MRWFADTPTRAPVALVLFAALGCALSHERAPGEDAAVLVDAAFPTDAFVTPDSGRPDAGRDAGMPLCPGVTDRATHVCVTAATGTLPSGEPTALLALFGSCECRACAASVREGAIELTTRVCAVPCDECSLDTRCELPPLAPGAYELVVDGARLGSVSAAPRVMTMVARPLCLARQVVDPPLECAIGDEPIAASQLCMRELIDVGSEARVEIRTTLPCDVEVGSCSAQLDGDRVLVRPRLSRCMRDCDPPRRRDVAIRCVSPPLRDGRYAIEVDLGDALERRMLTVLDITIPGDVICSTTTPSDP